MQKFLPYILIFLLGAATMAATILGIQKCSVDVKVPLLDRIVINDSVDYRIPSKTLTAAPKGNRVLTPRIKIPFNVDSNYVYLNLKAVDLAFDKLVNLGIEILYRDTLYTINDDSLFVGFDYLKKQFLPQYVKLAEQNVKINEKTILIPTGIKEYMLYIYGGAGVLLGAILSIIIFNLVR